MNDFSDLFYTIFSIVIFSFLLLQANSLMLRNDNVTVDHEYEKTAIALAQSIIEEAKSLDFDENMSPNSIPGGFNAPGQIEKSNLNRDEFTAFDHFHNYVDTIPTQLGDYEISVTVSYAASEPPFENIDTKSTSKRMTVTASSVANNDSATLEYIKSFF